MHDKFSTVHREKVRWYSSTSTLLCKAILVATELHITPFSFSLNKRTVDKEVSRLRKSLQRKRSNGGATQPPLANVSTHSHPWQSQVFNAHLQEDV
mmetsp:Transcript_10040/g.23226  ORF Transcript_10040/g.23226 Transcript_10040/m.23226 type:complete len:96 (+) Transcript_10040:1982-2269(+)